MRRRLIGAATAVTAVGGVVGGVVGKVVLDRRLHRGLLDDGEPTSPFGSVHGDLHEVTASDGLVLHAEVDEIAPYDSAADHGVRATLVFVHGFALNLDCWHFQRLAFRGKRRMVFYDQRSHGRSGRSDPEHATIDQLGRDLLAVLEALAPEEPVVLVGHSMGGMAVVALAEQHPELFGQRVVGLGLISTTAGGQRTHKMVSRWIPDAVGRRVVDRWLLVASERERLLELVRETGAAVSVRVIEAFAFGRPVPRSYVTFLDAMIASTPVSVLVEFVPQFDALDKFAVVSAFSRVPTLIAGGTADKLTSIGHARKLHAHIDGSRLVELPHGGHMPLLEHKDRVNDELARLAAQADERLAGG